MNNNIQTNPMALIGFGPTFIRYIQFKTVMNNDAACLCMSTFEAGDMNKY